jgi:hypothetical protein
MPSACSKSMTTGESWVRAGLSSSSSTTGSISPTRSKPSRSSLFTKTCRSLACRVPHRTRLQVRSSSPCRYARLPPNIASDSTRFVRFSNQVFFCIAKPTKAVQDYMRFTENKMRPNLQEALKVAMQGDDLLVISVSVVLEGTYSTHIYDFLYRSISWQPSDKGPVAAVPVPAK